MRALLLALTALVLASCARAPQAPNAPLVLTYASLYGPGHPFSRADRTWMEDVERRSGGTIRIRPFWSGALTSSEMNMLEVRHNVVDIALITPIYARGGSHVLRAQTGFYGGVRTIPDQVAVYRCLEAEFPALAHEFDGLQILAVQGGSLPGFLTRHRPVRTLNDLRGMRIRAPSELVPVLRELGADPVNMPMADVYSSLAKGVIDGVIAPVDSLRSLHFAEVARYYSRFHIARGAYPARAMSSARWNRLTARQRQILTESSVVWEEAMEREIHRGEQAGEREGATRRLQFVEPAAGEQARFDAVYNQVGRSAAVDLRRFNVDGAAMFDRTQALVAARNAGSRTCTP